MIRTQIFVLNVNLIIFMILKLIIANSLVQLLIIRIKIAGFVKNVMGIIVNYVYQLLRGGVRSVIR